MAPKRGRRSPSPAESEEEAEQPKQASTLSDMELDAMLDVVKNITDYRDTDGHDPSKVFARKVNKHHFPDYYQVITEPIAFSNIKQKINSKVYLTVKDFVRDLALIPHNAFVFNLPQSGAYQDAIVVKEQIESELKRLVESKVFTKEDATLPDLGEIPPADDGAAEDEEEEDDEEEEEDDDGDDDAADDAPKKRGRGRPRKSSVVKRESTVGVKDDKAEDPETRKKRGRPPKVLTPTEGRIQTVLKGLRKPKGPSGPLIANFERLPDKAAMPEYFHEIKNPMAYELLKRKAKRKKYPTLDHFMRDVELMFENAKQYNTDESVIYKDAITLQAEGRRLAEEVKARSDTEYAGDEGRIPMPAGILHNGELYKIGDWVLLQNVNDLTKPIPTQIYRTYQDAQGEKWINACWYYRPEQTVHRFDKHFLENEVVKTGQYRDHRIDEIVGRCFVMFVTRYFKGRPAGLPPDTDVFVCDSRYNEEKHTFGKIKTWASCLPDEVRDKDYAMEPFAAHRRMKKYPSPLVHLLKDEQKETDELPKPDWGADSAPPKIGAVHRRPRDPRDSPPPEPTPPPPPTPPPAPVQRAPDPPPSRPTYTPSTVRKSSFAPQQSPLPTPQDRTSSQRSAYGQPGMTPGTQVLQARPYQSQPGYPQTPSAYQQPPARQPAPTNISANALPPNPYLRSETAASYRGPPPIETYTLPEVANSSIPYEIRSLFQTDDAGRILFFTAPPDPDAQMVESGKSASGSKSVKLGHSARYLAAKARRADELAARREEYEVRLEDREEMARKRKAEEEEYIATEMQRLKRRAMLRVTEVLADGVE